MEAELFHEDGRTDMRKLIDAFRNFANATINTVLVTDTESQELMSAYNIKFVEHIFNYPSILLPFSAPTFLLLLFR